MAVEVIEVEPKAFLQDKRRKNWFWDHNEVFESDLSPNAKLVRIFLARCADGDRTAWPSLNTIAQRVTATNCQERKHRLSKGISQLAL